MLKIKFSIASIMLFIGLYANASTDTIKVANPPQNNVYIAPQKIQPIGLAGPRVGATVVFPGETADVLKDDLGMSPVFTQFGWQFEHQYFALENGVAGLVEFVGLIGGLEQGKFLPSATLLIGVRSGKGGEFAFGPNISLTGASFAFAAGHTFRNGDLYFPVNFAVVPSNKGVRLSLLFGFNARTK